MRNLIRLSGVLLTSFIAGVVCACQENVPSSSSIVSQFPGLVDTGVNLHKDVRTATVALDPTKSKVAFATSNEVFVAQVGSGTQQLVKAEPNVSGLTWTRSGDALILNQRNGPTSCPEAQCSGGVENSLSNLVRVQLDNGATDILARDVAGLHSLTRALEGKLVAFQEAASGLSVVDPITRQINHVDKDVAVIKHAWATSGFAIAYWGTPKESPNSTPQLFYTNMESNNRQSLGEIGGTALANSTEIYVGEEGNKVGFVDVSNTLKVTVKEKSIDTGVVVLREISIAGYRLKEAKVSPDGKSMIAVSLKQDHVADGIVRLNIEHGQISKVCPPAQFLHWTNRNQALMQITTSQGQRLFLLNL